MTFVCRVSLDDEFCEDFEKFLQIRLTRHDKTIILL